MNNQYQYCCRVVSDVICCAHIPGAVTSPTVLPPSSLPVSSSIGPSGSCRTDVSIDCNMSASGAECTIIFDREKHPDPSCVQLEDPEAEAEAAASAVAVAAISSDEPVGNELGGSSVSVSDAKSFGGTDISGLPSGCGKTIHAIVAVC